MGRSVSKVLETSAAMINAQAREMLATVAGQRGWSDTRESWLARAARRLGFGHRRTRAIFYGEARRITAEEWLRLTEEAEALKRSAAERQEALNDLDLLAGACASARREDARPMGVDCHATGKPRPGALGAAGKRPLR